jgi:hypothetical protein
MVKFFVYKGTTQTTCLRLMGKKMLVALMMEGKFSGEGIHSLEADDDMMSAMARELVERGRVGESANAVWADLKRERAIHMLTVQVVLETSAVESSERPDPGSVPELPLTPAEGPLVPVQSNPKRKQKPSSLWPTGYDEGAQMLLFS